MRQLASDNEMHHVIASLLFHGGTMNGHKGCYPGGCGVEKPERSLLIPALKSHPMNPDGAAGR